MDHLTSLNQRLSSVTSVNTLIFLILHIKLLDELNLLRPSDLETQDSYLNPFIAGLEFLFRVLRFSPFRVIFSMIISHFLIQEFRFTAKAERHQVLSLS